MIKLICIGKIKESYLVDLIRDYQSRIMKYHKIEIIELKDENNIEKEAQNIQKYLRKQDFIISQCIEGKSLSSTEFSSLMDQTFLSHGTITFIIGGSDGLSETIKKQSNYLLSFSKMTFPHGLFRGILLEQIYRSFKIKNNETYHK